MMHRVVARAAHATSWRTVARSRLRQCRCMTSKVAIENERYRQFLRFLAVAAKEVSYAIWPPYGIPQTCICSDGFVGAGSCFRCVLWTRQCPQHLEIPSASFILPRVPSASSRYFRRCRRLFCE
jgi:hypothetical protein